jgi:hypothetical protein
MFAPLWLACSSYLVAYIAFLGDAGGEIVWATIIVGTAGGVIEWFARRTKP